MSIDNVLASVAVKDIKAASKWYARLFERAGSMQMPGVAEWSFPRGGSLQIYELPERAGQGSFTLAVNNIEDEIRKLLALSIDASQRASNERVNTVMISDPDGNHIAFAEAIDHSLAR